jgi:hypothetical protein
VKSKTTVSILWVAQGLRQWVAVSSQQRDGCGQGFLFLVFEFSERLQSVWCSYFVPYEFQWKNRRVFVAAGVLMLATCLA